MGTAIIVVIVVVVIAALAFLVPASPLRARARRERLRRRFGPEYERIAAEKGDAGEADRELVELEHEHAGLELRTLPEAEVSRHRQAWTEIQVRFVDDPRDAARWAEREIGDVLTELGYPDADRDRQLALASVEHAQPVSGYRDAHRLVYAGGGATAPGLDEAAGTNADIVSVPDPDSNAGLGVEPDAAEDMDMDKGADTTGVATPVTANGSAVSDADTESLRQALLRYRAVFEELVGGTTEPAPAQRNGKAAQT
jgi:hypothetical protein